MKTFLFVLFLSLLCGCASVRPSLPSFSAITPSVKTERHQSTEELPPQQTAQACVATAESLEQSGYDREAILLYQKARRLEPQLVDYSRRLAALFDRSGQASDAAREYDAALRATPTDPDLLNDFGYFQLRNGDLVGSEQSLRKCLAVQSYHEHARSNLAVLLAKQGRLDESYELFASVVGPSAAHYNLGVVLAKEGRRDEASEALKRSLEIDPELRQAKIFLAELAK